jgi:hypothetical protein
VNPAPLAEPTSHIHQAKKAYNPSEPHIANVNPSPSEPQSADDSPEALLFSDFFICFGSKGSFLFGLINSHGRRNLDGTAGSRRQERVSDLSNPRAVCVGFRPDLARSSGFPVGSGQNPHLAFLSDRIQREIRSKYEYHVFRPILSSSLVGRCAWVTDLSSSLSSPIAVRVSLPLPFSVVGRRMKRSYHFFFWKGIRPY